MRGTSVHQEIGRGAPPRGESRPDDDVTHACLGSTPLGPSEDPLDDNGSSPAPNPQASAPPTGSGSSLGIAPPSVPESVHEPRPRHHLLCPDRRPPRAWRPPASGRRAPSG